MSTAVTAPSEIVALLLDRSATLGAGRLLTIDGPSGSGKTSLATDLASALGHAGAKAHVISMDELYDGWDGLASGIEQAAVLLGALAAGETGHYWRFDWATDEYGEAVAVTPPAVLILEGVGAGGEAYRDLATVSIWMDADVDVRKHRALGRDDYESEEQWDAWEGTEAAYFAADQPDQVADLTLLT